MPIYVLYYNLTSSTKLLSAFSARSVTRPLSKSSNILRSFNKSMFPKASRNSILRVCLLFLDTALWKIAKRLSWTMIKYQTLYVVYNEHQVTNNKTKWFWIYDREKRLFKPTKIDILPWKHKKAIQDHKKAVQYHEMSYEIMQDH